MRGHRFRKDEAWPKPVSAGTGARPDERTVVAPAAAQGAKGLEEKGLMSFARPGGTKRQTVDCWPIHTFTGDEKPGDINGRGVGGIRYAVSPDGKPAGASKK